MKNSNIRNKKYKNSPSAILQSFVYCIYFLLFSIKELIKSNITMYRSFFTTEVKNSSNYLSYKTFLSSNFKINLLSHVITLTPGTIVVNCDYQNKTLLIHCIFGKDLQNIEEDIRNGFERILRKI